MAPDADKLRQRKSCVIEADAAGPEATQSDVEVVRTLKTLENNEVCIDGVVYDLKGFDHPGGGSIGIFGGNDVSVTYKMIHPYHTEKHLEKLRHVGKVSDFVTEYKFDTDFEREIKREVFMIVRRGQEFGTWGWHVRCALYVGLFFYLQYRWVTQGPSWALAIIYGASQALIGLNVQHDANHGSVSRNHYINDILGLGADLIGGSKWLWLEQHWTHHTYTNHAEKDPDSFGAEPMMLFNDYPTGHPARTWAHKFQALYFLPVLAGYWLSGVFNPQILDLRHRGALSIGIKMDNDFIKSRKKYAWSLRLLYIYTNCVTPFLHQGISWSATFGQIMLMSAVESLFLAVLFSLSHNFENADRDPTDHFRKTGEPVCWFKSQVETSCTYGGVISGALTGGLNFQVEHHLFPRMSSAWYPYIAPKIRDICEKHGVKYVYYPWVFTNFVSTMKYMHTAGTGSNWVQVKDPLSGKNFARQSGR